MTGAAAAYGETQKNGAQLAIDEINARAGQDRIKIVPVFEDDASQPEQGVNVFNRLIFADKVVAIIGPTLSNTAQVTDRIAQEAGVPVLGISYTAKGITDIGDYIFRDSLTEMQVIPNTIGVVEKKLGIKKAARPRLLLLDGPSLGLAPLVVRFIFEFLQRLCDEGQTILLVEQNATEALDVSSYAYVIESGRIILEGRSDQLRSDPAIARAHLGLA